MRVDEIVGYMIMGALIGYTGGMFTAYLFLCQIEGTISQEITAIKKRIGWLTVRKIDRTIDYADEIETTKKRK